MMRLLPPRPVVATVLAPSNALVKVIYPHRFLCSCRFIYSTCVFTLREKMMRLPFVTTVLAPSNALVKVMYPLRFIVYVFPIDSCLVYISPIDCIMKHSHVFVF